MTSGVLTYDLEAQQRNRPRGPTDPKRKLVAQHGTGYYYFFCHPTVRQQTLEQYTRQKYVHCCFSILEAGSARELPWTRIGDGEMFEPASSYAPSTSSQLHFVLRVILAIRRPLINELARPSTCNVHPSISMST